MVVINVAKKCEFGYFKMKIDRRRVSEFVVALHRVMQHVHSPAGVGASLLYTISMAKRTRRVLPKQRKYSALVTDRELPQLRALVTTGLSHSSKGFSSHANVVDVALYDASLGV